jgi:hypothetical protein
LISITRRQQVAQIHGKPIYVITEVALTPLSSKASADASIVNTVDSLQKRSSVQEGEDGESDQDGEEADGTVTADDVEDHVGGMGAGVSEGEVGSSTGSEHKRTSSVAEDVMTRKGGYGRFAQKWFSKKGWTVDQRRNMGMTGSERTVEQSHSEDSVAASDPIAEATNDIPAATSEDNIKDLQEIKEQQIHDVVANLLPKLLRTTQILFGSSRSFYFAYDFDITRSLATKNPANLELPLHAQVDKRFFWNKHRIQPFIDGGHNTFVLPLMQGFVGQQRFDMDSDPPKEPIGLDGAEKSNLEMVDMSADGKVDDSNAESTGGTSEERQGSAAKNTNRSFLLTLISRRSVERAGLRYLRRGIDDEGNTANNVETEQILSDSSWDLERKIHSFVQIRGSIPVFFSQSPYSFKPIPQLHHSEDMNYKAFQKHISKLSDTYGHVQIASLVEKHGPEAIVGDAYEKHAKRLNESSHDGLQAGFEWFDFHAICRGMKFENVSLLMDSLGDKLDEYGTTVSINGQLESKQCGVLRTNCMDCLDRTNVVQSACGRRALELQLKSEGIDMSLQADLTTSWFNGLWADNGDAISKQYASTAALKGDFTRTRKRDFQGALKDMGLSISRFYSGYVIFLSHIFSGSMLMRI